MNLRQKWTAAGVGVAVVAAIGIASSVVRDIENSFKETERSRLSTLRSSADIACSKSEMFNRYCSYRLNAHIDAGQKDHRYKPKFEINGDVVSRQAFDDDNKFITQGVFENMRALEGVFSAIKQEIRTVPGISGLGELVDIRWSPVMQPESSSPAKGFGLVFRRIPAFGTDVILIKYDPVAGIAAKEVDGDQCLLAAAPSANVVAMKANEALAKLHPDMTADLDRILLQSIAHEPEMTTEETAFHFPDSQPKLLIDIPFKKIL